MRMFGWIGLVLALVVVGLLAKKQMSGPSVAVPSARSQGAQVRQEFQRQLDQAMQRPKTPSDDQ